MLDDNERARQYLRYLIHKGSVERYGLPYTVWEDRTARVETELAVIEKAGFSSYFIILAMIMDFCREENIPYGPGRGSVGGSYALYLAGIHEIDSLDRGLIFERFMTADRVSYPDVDIDVSQERRGEVIEFIRRTFGALGLAVLQVGAFQRSGGRGTINNMANAMSAVDPDAYQTAWNLRECLPAKGSITGGQKQEKELTWWLENGHGDRDRFREIAEQAGWLDIMLQIDGAYTGLTRHAAGVVILSQDDLKRIPQTSTDGKDMVTAFDMYSLDELDYLKYDILGLRTMDVIAEAHKFAGGTGATRDLMQIWQLHKDDPEPYELLQKGDSLGIFQMETDGYRRTLKEFEPNCFDHIVQLNALYRPGALDYRREDGKNMVEVFIDRRHNREAALPPAKELTDLLSETNGIFLYQEQAMKAVQILAGFDGSQADQLRKGIGKKRREIIEDLKIAYLEGCASNGIDKPIAERVWANIEAAARYSWNKSHSEEYGVVTWLTLWFKYHHPAAFYAATFNSFEKEGDRLSGALAEARQRVDISPPNINLAEEGFVATEDAIVFGLSGVKGMGEAGREMIMEARTYPFGSFEDFCKRVPSLPMNQKLNLIKCGAFDEIDDRRVLLAKCKKPGKGTKCHNCKGSGGRVSGENNQIRIPCPDCEASGYIPKIWTVAEHLNHNRNLKKPRPAPPVWEIEMPDEDALAQGEQESIGFYISKAPLEDVEVALARLDEDHFGGKVEKIYNKKDKNGGEYADLVILNPALEKQRVRIFASNWPMNRWVQKGQSIIVRGELQGETILGERLFEADDTRHFRRLIITRNGTTSTEDFDGNPATVHALESAGYEVKLR